MRFEYFKNSIFKCQKRSENFKFEKGPLQTNLTKNPFLDNFNTLLGGDITNLSHSKVLAKEKGLESAAKLHEEYWEGFRKQCKDSKSDLLNLKKYFVEYLEKESFPGYFHDLRILSHHYLESNDAKELYDAHSERIQDFFIAFYSGNYRKAKKFAEGSFVKELTVDSDIQLRQHYVERISEKILEIWDLYGKAGTTSSMIEKSLRPVVESPMPIKPIPKWEDLSKSEQNSITPELKEGSGHIQNKDIIIEKYKELRNKYTSETDSQIRSRVVEWYGKNRNGEGLNEGTIRYYLGEK